MPTRHPMVHFCRTFGALAPSERQEGQHQGGQRDGAHGFRAPATARDRWLAVVPGSHGYGRGCIHGAREHSALSMLSTVAGPYARSCCGAARLHPARVSEWVGHGSPLYTQNAATQGQRIRDPRIHSALYPRSAATAALCSAARGSASEARGYTGRVYPRSADLRTYCTRVPW
jgi:hypothetical protein